ncbi:hypothetical protein OHS71_38910 [Streptomyces sp. NBC_00377]|uniref:DUF6584 family protein n=1 Tax=unclassified Streptomyces TaxID=2593676 RepID=UPI002E20C542|nr:MULTISPECIES: DUF6584 family protein [unclassified Streptomyces]
MPLNETLARADADLAAGRVPMARQRLRGLVSSFPADLEPRRRLGEVYRLYGEPAEAGRWMYLEQDRDPAETLAFERRYATAEQRMRALAWSGPESLARSAFAREQLAAVRAACSDALGAPADWDTLPSDEGTETKVSALPGYVGGTVFVLVILVFLAIWVNGLVALFD